MRSYSTFSLLVLSLLFFASAAKRPTAPPPSSVCPATAKPELCLSVLSSVSSETLSSPYGYAKFSVDLCLDRTQKISGELPHYVAGGRISGAVRMCQRMIGNSIHLLEAMREDLEEAGDRQDIEDIRGLLSGVVSNQRICVNGLVAANGTVFPALTEASDVYEIAFGLVTQELARYWTDYIRHFGQYYGHRRIRRNAGIMSPPPLPSKPTQSPSKPTQSPPLQVPTKTIEAKTNGVRVKASVVVSGNGDGNFKTIGKALAVAPTNLTPEDGYFVIYIKEGVYEEYIKIPVSMTNIMFVGDGMNSTIITGDHNTHDGNWGTYNCSTVAIEGDRFVAIDVAFRNTAGPANDQAVAVRNSAHHSTFYRCSFEGYQDTLYVQAGHQFYRECNVYGTIDFIFGHSTAVFQGCNILARRPLHGQANVITAQGREDATDFSAITLQNCTVDAAPDLLADPEPAPTFLGRPWRPYATTVVMQSYLGATVAPPGWTEFNGTLGLDTLTYGEYGNYGPGADTRERVQWPGFSVMSATEAAKFTVSSLMGGDTWLPDTNVPFTAGL